LAYTTSDKLYNFFYVGPNVIKSVRKTAQLSAQYHTESTRRLNIITHQYMRFTMYTVSPCIRYAVLFNTAHVVFQYVFFHTKEKLQRKV